MNKKAEESAIKDGGTVEVLNEAQVKEELAGAATK
jgi:hypothetical protein